MHTYTSLRLAVGHNLVEVSGQLGHNSTKMTLDVYALWLPRQSKNEVDSLDTLHITAPQAHPEAINQ
jgi:integrase